MPRLSDRLALVTALLIAAVAIGVTIRLNTYVPWGTDSSAYVDAAAQWTQGELFHPTYFRSWAPWAHDAELETPLGRTPGAVPGTIVTVYPPGYPVLVPGQVFSPEILSFMRSLDTPEVHGYRPDLGYRVYTDKALEIAATARLAPPPDPAGSAAAPPTAT